MEAQKVILSLLVASTSAYTAYLIRKSLVDSRVTKFVIPTTPDFVDCEWTGLEQTNKQVLALKLIFA